MTTLALLSTRHPVLHLLAVLLVLATALQPAPARSQSGPLRWGYYVPWDTGSFESLRRHLGDLDVVALHWGSLDKEGKLVLEEQTKVLDLVKDVRGKVLVEVANKDFEQDVAHALLTVPEVRERALVGLADLVGAWGGLVLDFENLAPTDREAYTAFVRDLKARMPQGKTLAVAVAARTRDTRSGWSGGYDYAGLSRSADLIFLMAYAFRTASSPVPGPTGPLPWIEAAVQHALTQIPKEKLILGLPAFGYNWVLGEDRPDPPARSVVHSQAVELARQQGQQIQYDWTESGAFFRYRDGEHEREVWFEDARTFEQKLALVRRYGLRGVGWWRLGGEDPGAWGALGAQSQGGRFFPETGYAITSPQFLEYFSKRGEVGAFGYPISNEFRLLGSRVQLFQRAIMQLTPSGGVQLMNLLDRGVMPVQRVNFSVLPPADPELQRLAPQVGEPGYGTRVVEWARSVLPDTWEGHPVGFQKAFFGAIDCQRAFPNEPCQAGLLPMLAVELWGLPTSRPMRDPGNQNFIYMRLQRGVLHYDATSGTTQGILLGDYFKALLTGVGLPSDMAQELAGSPFMRQYNPGAALSINRPTQMPDSDLRGAFHRTE